MSLLEIRLRRRRKPEEEEEEKGFLPRPSERLRAEAMPMQQVRGGEEILAERAGRAAVYGAEEKRLPEVEPRRAVPEGLAPRTAEAFARPRRTAGTADVVPQAIEAGKQFAQRLENIVPYYEIQRTGRIATADGGYRQATKAERDYAGAVAAKTALELTMWYSGMAGQAIAGNVQTVRMLGYAARPYWYRWLDKVKPQGWSGKQMRTFLDKINTPEAVFTEQEKTIIPKLKATAEAEGISLGKVIGKVKVEGLKVPRVAPKMRFAPQEGYLGAGGVPATPEEAGKAAVPKEEVAAGIAKGLTAAGQEAIKPTKFTTWGKETKMPAPGQEEMAKGKPPGAIYQEEKLINELGYGKEGEAQEYVPPKAETPPPSRPPAEPPVATGGAEPPPEGMGGLPELTFREGVKPAGLATKIADLFAKIDEPGAMGRHTQERTIMNMIEKGQEIAGRAAFREGQKQGIFKTTEKFEEMIARQKERVELRQRVAKAREQIFSVDVKHLRPGFQQDIKGLIQDLDNVYTRSPKTLNRLRGMQEYLAEHPDNNIPQSQLNRLAILDKKPLGELTVEEIEDIARQVQHFAHLNKLKNKLIFGRRLRDLKEVVVEARQSLTKKLPPADPASEIDVAQVEKGVGRVRQLFSTDSYNPESIANILDRNPQGGPISEVMYEGINEGVRTQIATELATQDHFQSRLAELGISAKDLHRMSRGIGGKRAQMITVDLPSGKKISMTAGDRISLMLHAANPKNASDIMNYGFNFSTNLSREPFKLSKDDFRAIVDGATEAEKKIAYEIARHLNTTNKNLINQTSVDLDGFERATVDNYWTLKRNPMHLKQDPSKLRRNFTQATLEGMGILQERTGAAMPVVIEDAFAQFYKLIRQSSSYAGLAKPLRNAKMLLMDNDFKRDVIRAYGQHYWEALDKYLRQMEDNSHNLSNVDKLVTARINKLDLALLGTNPGVMLKQFPSFFLSMTEMESKYVLAGLRHVVGPGTKAEMAKWSPYAAMRLRGHVTREMGELGQTGAVRQFWTSESPLSHKVVSGIKAVDTQAVGRIWHAVKAEVADKHPELTGDAYMNAVARRWEQVVRRTQPTFDLHNRSEIGRDPSTWVRLMTKYTSQRNKNIQIIRRAFTAYDASGKTAKDKADLIGKLFLVTVGQSLMIEGINGGIDMMLGKKPKPLAVKLLRTFGNTVSYTYFVGDLFNSLISKMERGTYAGYDMSNPMSSMFETGVNAVAETYHTLRQIVEQEEYKSGKKKGEKKWKSTLWRAFDNWASLTGMLRGVPYATIRRYLKGGYERITEEPGSESRPKRQRSLMDIRRQRGGY